MDLAKAVALAVTHDGELIDHTASIQVQRNRQIAPLVAIPTTSGTGSEVSSGAVIIMNNGELALAKSWSSYRHATVSNPGLPAPHCGHRYGCDDALHRSAAHPNKSPAEAVACDGIERGIRDEI